MSIFFTDTWTWHWPNGSCVADIMRCVTNRMCSATNMMHGVTDMMTEKGEVGRPVWVSYPPYGKSKLSLKEYLIIFKHFESKIFYFFLENGLFQTHPPTKSGKFHFFDFFSKPFPWQTWMMQDVTKDILSKNWHLVHPYLDSSLSNSC